MKRVALVTGGAKRLGRAICVDLAAHGYTVVVHYLHSHQEALQTRELCLAQGVQAYLLKCDLAQKGERATLMARAIQLAGRVDLLVNSASLFEYDNVDSFSVDALEAHLQTNYLAPVELTMALFEHAKANPSPQMAHAISLLDQKLFNLNVDYMSYTLAKQANHASIRYLAQCCAPHLRVNAVAPGLTEISGAMSPSDFGQAHRIAALGKSSTPSDIAQAILMLDGAHAITGQTIVVDGGQHLVPRGRDVAFGE